MRLLALVARTQSRWSLVWVGLVGVLTVATAPAYESTYATAADRRAAVVLAQHDSATTLLYGRLPDPGNPAQMFAWEIGAYTTVLVAVAGMLLAVRLTRATEDAGTLELLRATGVHPRAPLVVALGWSVLVGLSLGAVAAGGLWLQRGTLDGFSGPGAASYGATVALTFLLVAAITLVLAQVLPTTTATRRAGALLLATALALRAWADLQHHPWVGWVSPLALRAEVSPFTATRAGPLLLAVTISGLLAILACLLEARREPGTGLIRPRATLSRRLHVRTPLALTARLGAANLLTWTIATTLAAALLTAMGSGVVTSARDGHLHGGFLAAQLSGHDPAAAYVGYTARILGIIVAVYGVLAVLTTAADERSGILAHLRATGTRRWSILATTALLATTGALLALLLAATASAAIAPGLLGGPDAAAAAFRSLTGQWPATVALIGGATAAVGLIPRRASVAWLPFAASVALTMLGGLLHIPQRIVDLSAFGHSPTSWNLNAIQTSGLLLLIGLALATLGIASINRRDEAID